jgi:predicted nuclease with TOPRIM domain
MLESVKKEYEKLQNEYKELFDWMRSEKKVEMRELFKRESQLAIDMAFIEGESYREGQKAKNEQIAKYQERLITLVRENQDLKTQILQTTS